MGDLADGLVLPPAFMDDQPRPKRRPIHAESAVQKGVTRAVKRVVAVPHEFVSHDRGKEDNRGSHIFEKQRGMRSAWPDTELVTGTATANVELKKPGWKPPREGTAAYPHWHDQERMLARLAALGRITGVATSVVECVTIWACGGVPLVENWRAIAAHEDELVAADIRKQLVRADGGGVKKRGFKARPSGSQIRAGNRFNAKRLGL